MGVLLVVFFPIILLAAAGGLGFFSAFFFLIPSQVVGEHDASSNLAVFGLVLAIGIPVEAAAVFLISRANADLYSWYGDIVRQLYWWALGAFAIGFVFGGGLALRARR
jgi:hypothetical protein